MSELEWDGRLDGDDEYCYRPETTLIVLADTIARKHGLDPALVCALCEVESAWKPWAVRHEAGYEWLAGFNKAEPRDMPISFMDIKEQWWRPHPKLARIMPLYSVDLIQTELLAQQTSWGLLGIRGADARKLGFTGWLTELCDPTTNLEWGCRHLRWMLDHPLDYRLSIAQGPAVLKGTLADLAAAWNGGKARFGEDGKYKNQSYVDRAVKAMVNYE